VAGPQGTIVSAPVVVTVEGSGHPLRHEILRREVRLIEDIAHFLEEHNDVCGIERVLDYLERARQSIYRHAGGEGPVM
jgi:hypothetical protein